VRLARRNLRKSKIKGYNKRLETLFIFLLILPFRRRLSFRSCTRIVCGFLLYAIVIVGKKETPRHSFEDRSIKKKKKKKEKEKEEREGGGETSSIADD
jgi:hypothetical protein